MESMDDSVESREDSSVESIDPSIEPIGVSVDVATRYLRTRGLKNIKKYEFELPIIELPR